MLELKKMVHLTLMAVTELKVILFNILFLFQDLVSSSCYHCVKACVLLFFDILFSVEFCISVNTNPRWLSVCLAVRLPVCLYLVLSIPTACWFKLPDPQYCFGNRLKNPSFVNRKLVKTVCENCGCSTELF